MDALIDKQYKVYSYLSRYTSFPYWYNKEDRKYIYGTTTQLTQDNISYALHKVTWQDTLDTLALDYYNNPTFFWVIADFNHIQDPFSSLEVGTTLKIPTLSDIKFEEV